MGALLGQRMASSDGFVLGRKTYEEWAAFWPHQGSDNPMAAAMTQTSKYVASTTLTTVEWENSTLLDGDVTQAVADLKREPGGDLQTSGSTTLVRHLLAANLVDELRLMVHPLVVGDGRRLFERGDDHRLELVDTTTLSTGVIAMTYALVPPAQQR